MENIRHSVIAFAFGLMVVVSTGCGAGYYNASAAELGTTPAGSNPAFVIRNDSGHTICYVYVSLSSDGNWGPDQLGASETIGPRATRGWRVPTGTYDFKLEDCSNNELDDFRGVPIAGDGVVLTHR